MTGPRFSSASSIIMSSLFLGNCNVFCCSLLRLWDNFFGALRFALVWSVITSVKFCSRDSRSGFPSGGVHVDLT